MSDQLSLFAADQYNVVVPRDVDERTSGEKRRVRQAAAVRRGVHPLSVALGYGIRLHPDAGPLADPKAPGLRCGTCRWRVLSGHHKRSYPKCYCPGTLSADQYEDLGPPRVTHGEGTDVRAFWPACTDHEYGDPRMSIDAARWAPSTHEQPESK